MNWISQTFIFPSSTSRSKIFFLSVLDGIGVIKNRYLPFHSNYRLPGWFNWYARGDETFTRNKPIVNSLQLKVYTRYLIHDNVSSCLGRLLKKKKGFWNCWEEIESLKKSCVTWWMKIRMLWTSLWIFFSYSSKRLLQTLINILLSSKFANLKRNWDDQLLEELSLSSSVVT